jgi:myo-inositol-1(or 4)-monophosphatase
MPSILLLADVVRKAGRTARLNFGKSIVGRFKEKDDLVTNVDLLIEKEIFGFIKQTFPGHGFDSEESETYLPDADYIWILDPIDGTKYYQDNIPIYSISLALQYKKEIIQGIVYLPETDDLFLSSIDRNYTSFKNDKNIICSSAKKLEDISVVLEMPNRNDSDEEINQAISILEKLIKKVKRVRVLGVGSISLCYCAMGGFDLYVNLFINQKHYDFSAANLILKKAEGYIYYGDNISVGGRKENVEQLVEYLNS